MKKEKENKDMMIDEIELRQQQLEKVTGGCWNGSSDRKPKTAEPHAWSPDEEPDNSDHL